MIRALAEGQGWLADERKLRRLFALSVGPEQRSITESYLKTWQKRSEQIEFSGFEQGRFQIAQYFNMPVSQAQEKLRQFPRGSRFHWSGQGEHEQKAFVEFSRFAADIGITITRDFH